MPPPVRDHDHGLAADLRRALGRDELHLVFQPIADLAGGELVAAEALVRWTHPERGPLPPSAFIPVAERHGLLGELGRFVLREACAAAARWPPRRASGWPLMVGVNLSPLQLADPGLADDVAAALAQSGLAPERLVLEVTETAAIEPSPAALATVGALRAPGSHLVLDDFGAGHSSLGALRRLPFDCLKLDRSLVGALGRDPGADAVVGGILAMGTALGLDVIAEGIETPLQLTRLRRLGCVRGQGYLLARPLPLERCTELLAGTPLALVA